MSETVFDDVNSEQLVVGSLQVKQIIGGKLWLDWTLKACHYLSDICMRSFLRLRTEVLVKMWCVYVCVCVFDPLLWILL